MLTRKSVTDADAADAEEHDSASELDKLMNMSAKALTLYEKQLDAELEELQRAVRRRLMSMDRVTRYRYERRNALINILRTRARMERWKAHDCLDVLLPMQLGYLKSKQKELLGLRWRLRTGIEGGNA